MTITLGSEDDLQTLLSFVSAARVYILEFVLEGRVHSRSWIHGLYLSLKS
jgi:hypothetical protein